MLRRRLWWLQLQELRREGVRRAWQRWRAQRPILSTRPVRTAATGPVEVRMLTWRRDWLNAVWALKSFYHYSGTDYPLVIHDGGLLPVQAKRLLGHFPDARFVPSADAEERFVGVLRDRGLNRCADYRVKNPTTRKLFDFFLDTTAEYVLTIDSDILFFGRPDLLIIPPAGLTRNRYNLDCNYWYSMPLDELEAAFGIRPPPLVNSGLAAIRRGTIDFNLIEQWLGNPNLFADDWVTEQTLHALTSTVHGGVELLPTEYRVGGPPGISQDLVCKHYPGWFRHQMYTEGMPALARAGFVRALRGA